MRFIFANTKTPPNKVIPIPTTPAKSPPTTDENIDQVMMANTRKAGRDNQAIAYTSGPVTPTITGGSRSILFGIKGLEALFMPVDLVAGTVAQ